MIEFRNVSFSYDKERRVLADVSFHIHEGESVGLIGANGAGKSTIMKLLLGLLEPSGGTVLVKGNAVSKKSLAEVRKTLGFVFQDSDDQMFMPTVFDDMMFAPLNYGVPREEAEARVEDVLNRLGISGLKNRYNHRISGGEKRMAAIATILVMQPEAILMDEPTSALDPFNRRMIINTVKDLKQTKLIASHDLDMIMDTCSRVILLSEGRITADGRAEEILRDKELLEANHLELPLSLSRG